MPDLLSHALIGWSLGTVLAWRYDWVGYQYVTAVVAGTFIPDVMKIILVIPDGQVEAFLGLPFSWIAIHTLGGTTILVAIGALVVTSEVRRRTTLFLALGGSSHLFADALLRKPDGHSYSVLWPVTRYQPPSPGLYLSTDLWPVVGMGIVAGVLYVMTRIHDRRAE